MKSERYISFLLDAWRVAMPHTTQHNTTQRGDLVPRSKNYGLFVSGRKSNVWLDGPGRNGVGLPATQSVWPLP